MSIIWTPAQRQYYVVMRDDTYDEGDFLASGQQNEDGRYPYNTDWPASRRIIWYDTEEDQQSHPALIAKDQIVFISSEESRIDSASGANITRNHASKAREAERIKFDNWTDLTRLPFIAADQALRPSMSIGQIADEIWAEHIAEAGPEAARVQAKRELSE